MSVMYVNCSCNTSIEVVWTKNVVKFERFEQYMLSMIIFIGDNIMLRYWRVPQYNYRQIWYQYGNIAQPYYTHNTHSHTDLTDKSIWEKRGTHLWLACA